MKRLSREIDPDEDRCVFGAIDEGRLKREMCGAPKARMQFETARSGRRKLSFHEELP
jgi:hypothetical protein